MRQWLTSAQDTRAYVEVCSKFITHAAFMLGMIPGLVRPDFLIEIEVVAAVPRAGETRTSNQRGPAPVPTMAHPRATVLSEPELSEHTPNSWPVLAVAAAHDLVHAGWVLSLVGDSVSSSGVAWVMGLVRGRGR